MRHAALRFRFGWWQLALAVGLSVLGAADGAHAGQRASGPRIVVTGEGKVSVAPDGDEVDLGSIRVWCDDDDKHGQFAVDIGDHDYGQREFDLNDEQKRASGARGVSMANSQITPRLASGTDRDNGAAKRGGQAQHGPAAVRQMALPEYCH